MGRLTKPNQIKPKSQGFNNTFCSLILWILIKTCNVFGRCYIRKGSIKLIVGFKLVCVCVCVCKRNQQMQ